MAEETLVFEAEVTKLLRIVANSLYSRREVFLRELISNASDACDRRRYEALTRPELAVEDGDYRAVLRLDAAAKTLSIEDNGIGMGREDLIDNLGTIARSGSTKFVEGLSGDADRDVASIGQFGVGFYSSFIVARRVDVVSRRAGEDTAWRWSSDGGGEFRIAEAERELPGTTVILHLNKQGKEFLDGGVLRRVVKNHSDHIALPVVMAGPEGEEKLNAASALWARPRNEVEPEQYREFYRHVSHGFDDPWLTVHARVEGRLSYALLLFVPGVRPVDLFEPEPPGRIRLYVRRVFVTDDSKGLLPAYLRFVRGVVDTEDIALNVSREMLQQDPILARIGTAATKRVLSQIEKKAKKDPDDYARFWENFGAVLKEGLYEDTTRREQLLGLARFRSTRGDGLIALGQYVDSMVEGQESIYTLVGDEIASLRESPHLEGYAARGIEVLLLSDPVDELWIPAVERYRDKPFVSITRGDAELDGPKPKVAIPAEAEAAPEGDIAVLVALLKQTLGDAVKDVRTSGRLAQSPVCLVADPAGLDRYVSRLLLRQGQLDRVPPGILEINPRHDLIRALAARAKELGADAGLEDSAWLLLDQARVLEGDAPPDPASFARRLTAVLRQAVR